MVPHYRELSVTVSKRGPSINYNIPDYTDLRAGVSYEIIFPEPVCKDPLDRPLEYSGIDSNGNSLPPYILLDLENNRIYGAAPALDYGAITVRLVCIDEFAQSESQLFNMVFNQNNNPIQHVTDFEPYTIKVAEGMDSVYLIPQGLFVDPDNDKIYYQAWYFANYSNVDTSFAKFNIGYEGNANITFTNPPESLKDNSLFHLMISDNIGATQPPFQIPMTMNLRPTLLTPTVSLNMYPNDTFTWTFDVSTYFSDPDVGDTISYSAPGLPSSLTLSHVSSNNYKISGDSSVISSDFSFNLIADDGFSLPRPLPVSVTSQSCHSNCTKCYGGNINECYS